MSETECQADLEAHKRNIQDAKEAHKSNREFFDSCNSAAIEFTGIAIKAFLLINGGAAVAMMGFVATVVSKPGSLVLEMPMIVAALTWFGWGVGAAALCAGLAYCVMYLQAAYAGSATCIWEFPYVAFGRASKRLFWAVNVVQIIAILAGAASLILFGLGVSSVAKVMADAKVPVEQGESN